MSSFVQGLDANGFVNSYNITMTKPELLTDYPGYACSACGWKTCYRWRNAKKEFKRHVADCHPEPRMPDLCASCLTNYADPPNDLCPACEAYQEH